MPESRWEGTGPEFTLHWALRTWVLRVDGPEPGLRLEGDGAIANLLSLGLLRAAGRIEPYPFTPVTLAGFELRRDRVVATFAPPDWGGLTVRAAWGCAPGDAVDLEVQASATSVGEIVALEVEVFSHWMELGGDPTSALTWTVEPRDVRSARLSYDGRETAGVLRGLTTLPVPETSHTVLGPRVFAVPSRDDAAVSYVEMVHSDDVARRVVVEPVGRLASHRFMYTRYGLFGHDLEKGVVLRARLRGCWTRSRTPEDDARLLQEEFLREPLPLGP